MVNPLSTLESPSLAQGDDRFQMDSPGWNLEIYIDATYRQEKLWSGVNHLPERVFTINWMAVHQRSTWWLVSSKYPIFMLDGTMHLHVARWCHHVSRTLLPIIRLLGPDSITSSINYRQKPYVHKPATDDISSFLGDAGCKLMKFFLMIFSLAWLAERAPLISSSWSSTI